MITSTWVTLWARLGVLALLALAASGCAGPGQVRQVEQVEQVYYTSPEQALAALLEAAKAGDRKALLQVLGPDAAGMGSGDAVADAEERQQFVAAAAEHTQLKTEQTRAVVSMGAQDWEFPIPLVKESQGWRFDTAAGKEELLNRRVGRNELHTLATMYVLVEAQYEYASQDRTGEGPQYAQRLMSHEGRRDGLFWPTTEGEPESPMGPLVAEASSMGYELAANKGPQPYFGYVYRLLKAQGTHAPGGARDYLQNGRLTGGFAVLAYPVEYGESGVMSFMVNQQGVVFQKDLGENTADLAAAITAYDPDDSWQPVPD